MRKNTIPWALSILLCIAVTQWLPGRALTAGANAAASPAEGALLSGTVRTADGKPLEGVAVSARATGTIVTRTVFTDERGEYYLAPLERAPYKVWAQATGFETARANVSLGEASPLSQAFTLRPIADITMQLSGSEWLAALPAATKDERRIKEIFRINCTGCHSPAVVLEQRFDEAGWDAIIDLMVRLNPTGPPGTIGPAWMEPVQHHRTELVKYLASVRGPNSAPLKFKPEPRPTGEAARALITQWDIPIANRADGLSWFDGRDWSEGMATSGNRGNLLHDVVVDNDGNAWMTFLGGRRTIAKLDVKTSQVTDFKVPTANGAGIRTSHGMARDPKGTIWFDMFGSLGRVDPVTETVDVFEAPLEMSNGVHISTDIDGLGKVWTSARYGALRLDPDTRKWKYVQYVRPQDGHTYGSAGDADGNGWFEKFHGDAVGKGDPKTGQSFEVAMQPPWVKDKTELWTPEDREFYESIGVWSWGRAHTVPGAQGPRRMGADKKGDSVYVANFFGNNIVRINIRTMAAKYYRLPMEGQTYMAAVDPDHNVWVNLHSDDRVMKLDPKTEKWTAYRLPTTGCEMRHISVDPNTGDVWSPCHRLEIVNRIQQRTVAQLEALKNGNVQAGSPAERPRIASATQPSGTKMTGLRYDMSKVVIPPALSDTELHGRRLFTQRCAACHDPETSSRVPGPWLDDALVRTRGDAAIRDHILKGSRLMPGFQYMFEPAQVDLIVAYLKSVKPEQRPARAGS